MKLQFTPMKENLLPKTRIAEVYLKLTTIAEKTHEKHPLTKMKHEIYMNIYVSDELFIKSGVKLI